MRLHSGGRRAATALLIASGLLAGLLPAGSVAASSAPIEAAAPTDALQALLQPDGSLRSDLGPDRTIDATGWALKASPGGRAAPRFERKRLPSRKARTNALAPAGAGGTVNWASLGSNPAGNGMIDGEVLAMAVYKNELIVGGAFAGLAGVPGFPSYIGRWNGSRWQGLGNGASIPNPIGSTVRALAVFKDELYVGGSFENAGGIGKADYLARWNGTAWKAVGDDGSGGAALCCGLVTGTAVYALAATKDNLYVGGSFKNAAGLPAADHFARWSGSVWSSVGQDTLGDGAFETGGILAISIHNGQIYVGGGFTDAADEAFADYLAYWTGEEWLPVYAVGVDGPINCAVYALLWVGSDLYIGGCFTNVRAQPSCDHITVFNGGDFACLGDTGGNGVLNGMVRTLTNYNGNIVVGGEFTNIAGLPRADYLATWIPDTTTWSTFGSDGAGDGAFEARVQSLFVWGDRLVVGSPTYNIAGLPTADSVAAWSASPRRQPDAQVKLPTDGTFTGDNTYQPKGTWQERVGYAFVGQSVTYQVVIQNDGGAATKLRVKGPKSNAKVAITYKRGATNVTAAVVAGTYLTPKLAPGASQTLTVIVKAKAPFGVAGSKLSLLVTASSPSSPVVKDGVRLGFWYPE